MTFPHHWPGLRIMRWRRHLLGWLTALLLMQWVGAHGHCQRFQADAFTLFICTAEGLQRVTIPGDTEPAKPAADLQDCGACHALPFVACPAAPDASTRIAWVYPPDRRPGHLVMGHALARPRPPPARAPPALS